jgi:transcriptional regulator with XRE-family HTH domain
VIVYRKKVILEIDHVLTGFAARRLREQSGIALQTVADRMGYKSKMSVWRLEAGQQEWDEKIAFAYIQALILGPANEHEKARAHKENKRRVVGGKRARKEWTTAEDVLIVEASSDGIRANIVAEELGRSVRAVHHRAKFLGVKIKSKDYQKSS